MIVDRYTLLRRLGEGGVGIVYLAEQRSAKRLVAVKLLPAAIAQSPLLAGRFRREAALLSRLLHPSIVKLHDLGETPNGDLWMALEYLHGENLAEKLQRRPRLSIEETSTFFRPICESLWEMHCKQMVHRDIKPENLFLSQLHEGKILPKLIDLGLAASRSEDALTQAGSWGGSMPYMSPEHWRSLSIVEPRSDQYSLAVVIYRCLAGRLPFEAKSRVEWGSLHMYEQAPSLCALDPNLPRAVGLVLQNALAKETAQRYSNIIEFWSALDEALSTPNKTTKPAPQHQAEAPSGPHSPLDSSAFSAIKNRLRTPEAKQPEATVLFNTAKRAMPKRQSQETGLSTRLYRRDPARLRPVAASQEKAFWLRSISGQPHQQLFAVGSHGALLRSKDGGTFHPIQLPVHSHLNSVWSYDRFVCSVGANGAIISSSDGGDSFTKLENPEKHWLWSCFGTRDGDRFAVGENGVFYSSRDAGVRWRTTTLADGASLYAIWGELHGSSCALYVVGKRGLFLRSMNAGVSWEQLKTPTQQDLLAVWGDRNGELMLVGRNGVMLRSKNRGQSFSQIESSCRTTLYGVFGLGDARFAIGDGGVLLHSPNGADWLTERVGSSALYGLCGTKESLFIVGNNGTLLRFSLPESKRPQKNLAQVWG